MPDHLCGWSHLSQECVHSVLCVLICERLLPSGRSLTLKLALLHDPFPSVITAFSHPRWGKCSCVHYFCCPLQTSDKTWLCPFQMTIGSRLQSPHSEPYTCHVCYSWQCLHSTRFPAKVHAKMKSDHSERLQTVQMQMNTSCQCKGNDWTDHYPNNICGNRLHFHNTNKEGIKLDARHMLVFGSLQCLCQFAW